VPRRDADAIADRLAELAGDPALRRSMGRAARLRDEERLSLEGQLDAFEALYDGLLREPAAAPEALPEPVLADAERERAWRRAVVADVRAFVEGELPPDAHVLVVSRGDEEIVAFPGHVGGHFPQVAGGDYAGHHPTDSAEAIAHLASLREAGAEYLVIPATSGWWLDHYADLARHLEDDHNRVASADDRFVAFALGAAKAVSA
jgi:hypothetical protein